MDFDETLIDPAPGPVRALIFDFDGLILDTELPIFTSWSELYEAQGGCLAFSDWLTVVGTVSNELEHFDWLENQIGRTLDHASLSARRRLRQHELIERQPVLPGIIDTLHCAREMKMKIGLASSSPRAWVEGHLTRLGLMQYFDCIRTRDDVSQVKPDPELYLRVLHDLDLQPHEALVLEDSPIGVLAGRRAGLYVVAIPNEVTRSMPLEHASLRLDSLAEIALPDLLALATRGNRAYPLSG